MITYSVYSIIRFIVVNKKCNKNAYIFSNAFTFNQMVDLDVQIKSIQDKLQQLLRQQALLQKENQQLKKELEKTTALHAEKQVLLQNLQQQSDAVKLGSGAISDAEKSALSKRIDLYLKEIDKCLALLNT